MLVQLVLEQSMILGLAFPQNMMVGLALRTAIYNFGVGL
jgi:hypothetical protein